MHTLFIYADFDWLSEPLLVGELGYESLRGSDSYSFKFDNEWLRQYGGLKLPMTSLVRAYTTDAVIGL